MRGPARAVRRAALLLALACALPAVVRAASPEELFQAGKSAYDDGRYDEAVAAYRQILALRIEDPRVLFNLGNACFKQGRLGPAILNYERALRLDPGDREVLSNLDLARGQIRDRVAEPELQYPIRVVKDTIDATPPDPLAWIFLCFYFAAAACMGGAIVTSSWVRRRLLFYAALLLGLVVMTSGVALTYKHRQASADVAIVMQDKLDVRSGPGDENTVLFTVHEGTRLEMRNRLDPWIQVSLPNGLSGWVPSGAVEKV